MLPLVSWIGCFRADEEDKVVAQNYVLNDHNFSETSLIQM